MDLPGQCYFNALGKSRLKEISALTSLLNEDFQHGRRPYQNLPRHMQRRAMSSNPKRVPKNILKLHTAIGSSKVNKTKRPSRKYRRRPTKLLTEYNRRQRDNKWLETHIWHAKRFHMTRKWGYALPDSPTTKGHRSTIRAALNTCLMQDISYMNCFELNGSTAEIVQGFMNLLLPADLKTFTAHLNGNCWTSVFLYSPNKAPAEAIGSADIICHPSATEENKTIWVWVHPSTSKDVQQAFSQVYSLVLEESGDILDNNNVTQDPILKAKIALRNVPFSRTPRYISTDSTVSLNVLNDTLNRFRLTGPESQTVLAKVFLPSDIEFNLKRYEECVSVSKTESMTDKITSDIIMIDKTNGKENNMTNLPWWKEYYENDDHKSAYKAQIDAWQELSAAKCDRQYILPLTVRDPRVILPRKKIALKTLERESVAELSKWSNTSPIFSSQIRDQVTVTKCADSEINRKRSDLLVRCELLPLESNEARLPVLLLHRNPPFNDQGDGWDVILPCGWGTVTWVSLRMNGGVPSGQVNEQALIKECILPQPSCMFPDTFAGSIENEVLKEKNKSRYFARPPNNRVNFIKLGIQFPFHFPWLKMIKSWKPSCDNIKVLRGTKDTLLLSKLLNSFENNKNKFSSEGDEKMDTENTYKRSADDLPKSELEELKLLNSFLIHVRFKVIGKGTVEPNAMICLPLNTDNLDEQIEEVPHKDINQNERIKLKEEHKKINGKLKKQKYRIRRRDVADENEPVNGVRKCDIKQKVDIIMKSTENQAILKKKESYRERMNSLWLLPETSPIQMCSRKIIGYATQGGFCASLGKCSGMGFLILQPILENKTTKLLVRNPNEFIYRWIEISLL